MKIFNLLFTAALFTTLVSCVNGDTYGTPDLSGECANLAVTKQVIDITSTSTTTYAQYTGNDIIEAYVTSSDEGGNFYKSISLISLDGTVGFSLPIDAYNLYTKFEPGRKVFVNMKDRYFVTENNATIIGSLYNNDTPADLTDDGVGRISGVEYQSIITRSCSKTNEDDFVKHLTIAQAKNNQYLNMLIELDGVQFTDASLGKNYYEPSLDFGGSATNHLITDNSGSTITVRVSQFAVFAAKSIPSGSGKLRGVLTKYGSTFQFMIRTENDVHLTETRSTPILNETFDGGITAWNAISLVGTEVWTHSAMYGNPGACAKMSGFASTNKDNEDWLISPVQNLSSLTSASLSFDNAYKFSGNPIEILVSNNYSGAGDPNATGVTWTVLTGALLSTGNYTYTNSGDLSLSSFIGAGNNAVYIAFKYTSTTSGASTWEIDNVKITGN